MAERTAASRSAANPTPIRVRFDAFELDEVNASLRRDGEPIALGPTPFAVLCALARQPGALLTKHALLDEVWGHQFVSDSVLKTAISDVRTVLEDDARRPRLIETVSRRGYRFIAATTPIHAEPSVAVSAPPIDSSQATSFVGRAEALLRLRRSWDVACNGKRTIVWVAGEPGIGKTTLIDHFVAGLSGIICVRGQCVEHYGPGEPYLPVLEALGELCRRDGELVSLLRTVAPTWLLQLPWLCTAEERDALRRELTGVGPERMLREMAELIDRYTERVPLLLVTEDLHWSDHATVELIDYIARRRGNARFMWLASFRLAEVVSLDHPLNRLRHELRVHGMCDEIVLDPFSETEIADYVCGWSESLAKDEAFVRALQARTDGVPLFVASVIDDVVARSRQGDDEATGTARLANVAVPDNLASIIDHYIAQLDNDERALLSAAAVCGVEFRVSTISHALERDALSVAETCAELARRQLWLVDRRRGERRNDSEAPYSFRHALFRQVLYERTTPTGRAKIHAKVGNALERDRAAGASVAPSELALHFERGHEPMAALRYYVEAAQAAVMHLSPAECMALTERALALLDDAPDGRERDALEIAASTLRGVSAFHVLGVGAEAKAALERAYALLDRVPEHPMRTLLLHVFGFVLCVRADYAEATVVADRAEALSSASKDPFLVVAACIVHGNVDQLQGRYRAACSWIERGLAVMKSLDAAPPETFIADPYAILLGMCAVPLIHLGFVERAHACLKRAHERAREVQQPMARMVTMWYEALVQVRLGNAERVAAIADEMQALVDEFGLALGGNGSTWFQGWANARMGEPLDGYRRIRQGYEQNARLGMRSGASETLGYAAEALALSSDWDAAHAQLQEALQVADTQNERVYLTQLFLTQAAIARGRGHATLAQTALQRAVAEARAQEAPWLELLARIELCQYEDATAEDRSVLAALVDQLTEATATSVVAKARELLRMTFLPEQQRGRSTQKRSVRNTTE